MKINDMIKQLQLAEKKYGNIEVIMASDSEGNSYSTIDENFRHSCVYEKEQDFITAYNAGTVTGMAVSDIIDDFYKHSKVIGICLYPFAEDFMSAEEACNANDKKEPVREHLTGLKGDD